MPPSSVQKLAHAGRALLLVGALCAAGTAAVWTWRPAWIEAYETSQRERVLSEPRAWLEQALEAEAEGDLASAIAGFEDVARRLEDVRPGERLEASRTKALERLVTLVEDPRAKLAWAETWTAFDELNAPGLLQRAQARLEIPEERERGIEELGALFDRLPETPFVAEAWFGVLSREGRHAELLEGLHEHYERLESCHWKLNWSEGVDAGARELRGFLLAQLSGDELRIEWILEAAVAGFRLYLPPHASLTLIEPELTISRAGSPPFTFELPDERVRANRMVFSGRSLQSREAGDAYFEFELPEEARGRDARYVFRARLGDPPHELLAPHLNGPGIPAAIEQLRAAGRTEVADWAARASLGAVAGTRFQLFYRADGEDFAEARSVRPVVGGVVQDTHLAFETRLEIAGPATRLRLDFPETLGLGWRIDEYVLEHAGGESTLSVQAFEGTPRRGLELRDGVWTVTQSDPWVELPIDSAPAATALRISGVVR